MKKTVSQAIKFRRSVRVFKDSKIKSNKVKSCNSIATLAPNSSNLQLWEFIHVNDPVYLNKLSKACMNQSAAKTASQIVVVVTRKNLWRKRAKKNIEFLTKQYKDMFLKHLV